jgi:hypothetical protein
MIALRSIRYSNGTTTGAGLAKVGIALGVIHGALWVLGALAILGMALLGVGLYAAQ